MAIYTYKVTYRYSRKGEGQRAVRGSMNVRAASAAMAYRKARKVLVEKNARPTSIDLSAMRV